MAKRRRQRPKSQRQYVVQNDVLAIAAKLNGARPEKMPRFIEPSLATLTDKVPDGAQWIHEIKFDGYRLQLRRHESDIRFFTRRGHDWTRRFDGLMPAAGALPNFPFILDGEVVVTTASGHSDFGALEADLAAGRSDRMTYYAFDILHIGSKSLRGCALADRKAVLSELLDGHKGPIRFSDHIDGGGKDLFKRACKLGLEGLVSKRLDAPYRSGRSLNWTKVTCRNRESFYAVGIANKGKKFDGVYLARRDGDELLYAGKVERGFTDALEKDLKKRLEPFKTPTQPLTRKVKKPKATWFKPRVLVDVEFRALTGTRKLRHPSYKGCAKT
jgi:bifunctional non-homologous end joining protein LigD